MKKIILLLLISLVLNSCEKDDEKPKTELEKLPPITEIGANKVGCLLDGIAFLPSNEPNSTNCFYQLVDGKYFFVMAFDSRNNDFEIIGLGLGTRKLQIYEGSTYNLIEFADFKAYGGYSIGLNENFTNQINTGTLTITKLTNQIVSGTFSYDIADGNGVIHKIREGRFDFQYTN